MFRSTEWSNLIKSTELQGSHLTAHFIARWGILILNWCYSEDVLPWLVANHLVALAIDCTKWRRRVCS